MKSRDRMNRTTRAKRVTASGLLGASLLLAPGAWPSAATLVWTGLGTSARWSEPANWSPGRAPADGDDLLFAGSTPRQDSVLDVSHSFAALVLQADALAYLIHVQGDGVSLSFAGAGIRNLTAGSGPIRQQFFADAGTAGGSIVFTGSAGINLGGTGNFRPVDITALGGSAAAPVGGHIVFQDNAATSGSTYDALRAEGASAAGAVGGDIIFRNNALATKSSSITVTGGSVLGAAGAQASFLDLARVDGTLNVLAGAGGGLGARMSFAGDALASAYAGLMNQGARALGPGAQAITSFRDNAKMLGSASNEAGTGNGFEGGWLEFRGHASHDTTGLDPSLGYAQIINGGSGVSGAHNASTFFYDDAFVSGSRLLITNANQGEGSEAGTIGGSTEFRDRSHAGQATIVNQGALSGAPGTPGGWTWFRNLASAERAAITNNGGVVKDAQGGNLRFTEDATASSATLDNASGEVLDALGGTTQFLDRASAGGATIRNAGGKVAGAFSGSVSFDGNSSAGSATIVNAPGEVASTNGGRTRFSDNAGAGTAYISNDTTFSVGGGAGGSTVFSNNASAQRATIDNLGGLFLLSNNGQTSFTDSAVAGNARITNLGGRAAGAIGGGTSFNGNASAGAATLVMAGGGTAGALGGYVSFDADASAGSAVLDLRAANVAGAYGSRAFFRQRTSAGTANFSVEGSRINSVLGPEGARVTFSGTSTAANATFAVGGNLFDGGDSGRVVFNDSATAANASFLLLAGTSRGGVLNFEGADALNLATAGNAHITNQGSSPASASILGLGGQTTFIANSTAARAVITNEAGINLGLTSFFASSAAGDANIVNLGGSDARAGGGGTQFNNSSTAERAVIVSHAGAIGLSGFDAAGTTSFVNLASAGSARITALGANSATDVGGLVSFRGNANPASATLIAEGGTGGGTGGRIRFSELVNSSVARVIVNAGVGAGSGGTFDISGLSAAVSGVAVGSIEGGGFVDLGGKKLTLWSNAASTSFSGLVRDGGVGGGTGGSLGLTGGANLTLTGANTYSGGTRIGDGLNAASGKLTVANLGGSATGSGAVVVARGGTLAGSGFIAGPVTLNAGGTIAPGDPVTLTLRDSLTWDGGGVIRLVLGADSAGSDHLNVGSLIRGTNGPFVFDLVNFGVVAGASYDLVHYDSLVGFAASDFSFSGVAGTFALSDGSLGFTATAAAVPEPGTAVLWMSGLLLVLGLRRRGAAL